MTGHLLKYFHFGLMFQKEMREVEWYEKSSADIEYIIIDAFFNGM